MESFESNNPLTLKILINLLRKRWMVLAAALIGGLSLALLYTTLSFKEYSTRATIIPVQDAELSALKLADIYSIDAKTSFLLAEQKIFSVDTAANFIAENEELRSYLKSRYPSDNDSQMSRRFIESLSLQRPNTRLNEAEGSFLKITFKYDERIDGPKILDLYLTHAQSTIKRLIADKISNVSNAENERIETALSAIREKLRLNRESRVVTLSEALSTARKIKIENFKTLSQLTRENGKIISVASSGDGEFPLYLLGAEALTSEIEVLKTRSGDDHDDAKIAELLSRKLEISMDRVLRSLAPQSDAASSTVAFYAIASKADTPLRPDSPRKLLSLMASAFLSLLIGVMLIVMQRYLSDE